MTPSPSAREALPQPETSARTDEIRRTAAALFERSGYSATTMTHIADAAGILPGSLYHHFGSKEEIAVELLEELHHGLHRVAVLARERGSRSAEGSGTAEERLVALTAAVIGVSQQNAAAVRLRSYDAPTVATDRFREAIQLRVPSLDQAWRQRLGALAATSPEVDEVLGLLRYCLPQVALSASTTYPLSSEPERLAGQLCDALLHGLLVDVPADEELDGSDAMAAAEQAIAEWPEPYSTSSPDSAEAIRAAARIEFARRGYDATTIRDVAEAAGVRMGTLYRRLESKEALLRDVLESYSASMEGAVGSALTTRDSTAASLDAFARVFVHAKRRFRLESDIVKFGWSGRESTASPFHGLYLETMGRFALMEQLLDRGLAAGEIRPIGTAPELANHIRAVMWLPYQDYARTGERRALRFLRRTILRGVVPPA